MSDQTKDPKEQTPKIQTETTPETNTKEEAATTSDEAIIDAAEAEAPVVAEKPEKPTEVPIKESVDSDEEEVTSSDDSEEDETTTPEEEVDYSSLSKEELIAALDTLIKEKPVQHIKNEVEQIKAEFASKFSEELETSKASFLAEGGNIIDFHYTTPLQKQFNSLYYDFKDKRNSHFKNLKKDLEANLVKRQGLVEELKGLLNAEENINTTYNHFKEIQSKWHEAGAIPRDKYNIVWNTYHHHVENFYDYLHLNREFRDLDFKHNLDQKLKLINRAEELGQEEDISKAFRELQTLHKMWKEELGPVAKEYRDDVWDKFSAATKVVHDKRQVQLAEFEKEFKANYETKKEVISQISAIATAETPKSHKEWQDAMKRVQELRDTFFETGKVPRNNNKEIWGSFKEATRTFNASKNAFYKDQKKEQFANLEKKRELIKIADEHKDSDDFEKVTQLMKKIQSDWKKIGHVPRRDSDKVWKQFKGACNHYFDRINAVKNEANKEELGHYEAKNALLESMSDFKLEGDHKENLAAIKTKITEWKAIGRVPYNKRNIEEKFNKKLDGLFGQLDLGKKETEMIKFNNKLDSLVSQEDDQKLRNEHFFLTKKVEEAKAEINQLENNLGFFQHVKEDNPLVKEVHKNIAKHKEDLEVWKAKLQKIKSVRNA